ncbi:MAG: hypothetical protein ACLPJW_02850, partial [Rhodomicrobium sp.]
AVQGGTLTTRLSGLSIAHGKAAMKTMLISAAAVLLIIPVLAGLFIAANWAPAKTVEAVKEFLKAQ